MSAALQETKDQLARDFNALQSDTSDQKATYQSSMKALSDKNQGLRLEIERMEAMLSKPTQSVGSVEGGPVPAASGQGVETLKRCYSPSCAGSSLPSASAAATAETEEELRATKENLALFQLKVQRTVAEMKEQASDIEGLRAQLRLANEATATSLKANEQLKQKVGTLVQTCADQDAAAVKLKREMSEWQIRIQEEKKITAREQDFRKDATAKLSAVELEMSRRTEEHATLRANLEKTIESVQVEHQESVAAGQQLTSSNKALQDQVELLKTATTSTLDDIKRLANEKGAAVTKQKEMQVELDATRADNESWLKKNAALETESEILKAQLLALVDVKGDLDAERENRQVITQESTMMKEASERAVKSQSETAALLDAEKATSATLRESLSKTDKELGQVSEKGAVLAASLEDFAARCANADAAAQTLTAFAEKLRGDMHETSERLAKKQAAYAVDMAAKAEALHKSTAQIAQLQQELSDSEAQRKLDKRKGDKRVQDLTRQLQKANKRESTDSHRSRGSTSSSQGHTPPRASAADKEGARAPASRDTAPPSPRLARSASSRGESRFGAPRLSGPGSPDKGAAPCGSCAKLEERLRFLESHAAELTNDLKKQRKIINAFLLREEHGKLAPPSRRKPPQHQAKSGYTLGLGAVTSAFSSKKAGPAGMTLELALEMNATLQQVTEDTLLKNISLQESLDIITSQMK